MCHAQLVTENTFTSVLIMKEPFQTGDEFTDFILRITHEIWEEGQVLAINDYYGKDVIVRSPSGVTTGCQSVVDSTYATLKEFPDRQLLGEDVIHCEGNDSEWLSSHRIFSTATHLGQGYFGDPTGCALRYRVVADCAVRDGVIFDEWLVRDFGAIVRQMGSTPEAAASRIVQSTGGSTIESDTAFRTVAPLYTHGGNGGSVGPVLVDAISGVLRGNVDAVRGYFDRAAQFDLPGGMVVNGRDFGLEALRDLFAAWSLEDMTVDHVIGRTDSLRGTRGAARVSFSAVHSAPGQFGEPTRKRVEAMTIWHAEFSGRKIQRLFLLMDEVALWRQILSR